MPAQKLDLEDYSSFQKLEWRWQRVGWTLWILIIIAALAGLLGTGPLSNRRVQSSDGQFTLKYDRFTRHHHPSQFEIMIPDIDSSRKTQSRVTGEDVVPITIELSRAFMDDVEIRSVQPEPVTTRIMRDGVAFIFHTQPGNRHTKVQFYVDPEKFGQLAGTVRVNERSAIPFQQFVYP